MNLINSESNFYILNECLVLLRDYYCFPFTNLSISAFKI